MFDEIFKRWINMEQLTENDIVPLFLEWNQVYGDKKATTQEVLTMMNLIQTNYYPHMEYILRSVGIQKGYKWEEIRDTRTGKLLARFAVDKQ